MLILLLEAVAQVDQLGHFQCQGINVGCFHFRHSVFPVLGNYRVAPQAGQTCVRQMPGSRLDP